MKLLQQEQSMHFARKAAIGVAIAVALGCSADKPQPTELIAKPKVASFHTSEPFFTSWSWYNIARTGPIPTLPFAPDATLPRVHWGAIGSPDVAAAWAQAHPGKLFIVGDELDKDGYDGEFRYNPAGYAALYCGFARQVKGADATARFTPGGITHEAQPWWYNGFYDAYQASECGAGHIAEIPIAEWTFHYLREDSYQNVSAFIDSIAVRAQWAVGHGAPLSLGAWDIGKDPDVNHYISALYRVKEYMACSPNIVHSRYEAYEDDGGATHPLATGTDANSPLSAVGEAMAAPANCIQGPAYMHVGATCTFHAVTAGNVPNYSHYWVKNGGEQVGFEESFNVTASASGVALQLTTTDGNGRSHITTKNIALVSWPGPGCFG
jgi:hypothetical protein